MWKRDIEVDGVWACVSMGVEDCTGMGVGAGLDMGTGAGMYVCECECACVHACM